jgi:hypothetical protein
LLHHICIHRIENIASNNSSILVCVHGLAIAPVMLFNYEAVA